MSKQTILVDGHVLDGAPQGTCSYIAGLYGALARRGDFRILIATKNSESISRWFPDGGGIDWLPLRSGNKYYRLAFELDEMSHRYGVDWSHFQYITPISKRSKWIVTIHDLLFLEFPQHFPLTYRLRNRILFEQSARRSDVILTVSQYSKRSIVREFSIDPNRVHVTTNGIGGVTVGALDPVEDLVPGKFFVYVSRIEPRKNQDRLILAFIEMAENLPDGFKLVLVGNRSLDYPALDAQLAVAADRVRHMSGLSAPALTWLYANAAASIYPSLGEGFGIPPIEAVAAGGVSYCAANTALVELADHVHGTFNSHDPEDMKRIMRRAVDGDDTVQGAALRERVARAYSWEKSADQFIRALRLFKS